jgi:hypothetical protein
MSLKGLEHLVCPISLVLPNDPVIAEDGHVYERKCIQKHLAEHRTSPLTNAEMGSQLINGRQILNMLRAFADAELDDELLREWASNVAYANRRESLPTGETMYFEKGEHVRTEYAATHDLHGVIRFFEDGTQVRDEFTATLARHGEIDFFENNKHVRTEFAATHVFHGCIDFFEDGKHVRTEYAATLAGHGAISFFEDGKKVRDEFAATHSLHGVIGFFDARTT